MTILEPAADFRKVITFDCLWNQIKTVYYVSKCFRMTIGRLETVMIKSGLTGVHSSNIGLTLLHLCVSRNL